MKKIVLIGASKEREFVESVFSQLDNRDHVENLSGKTTLCQLTELLASARLMVSSDSGPLGLAPDTSTGPRRFSRIDY